MNLKSPLPPPEHEKSDAQPRLLALLAGVIAGLILLALGAGRLLVRKDTAPASNATHVSGYQDGVRERLGIARDWQVEDAEVQDHLEKYGWVDRQAGLVRVPIHVAMDAMLNQAGQKEQR